MRLSRRRFLAGLGAGIALGAAGPALAQKPKRGQLGTRPISVTAYPLRGFSLTEPARRDFGRLTFLGGIEMRADDPDFGGISGVSMEAGEDRFLAVTDHGHWVSGRIRSEGGAPVGIEEASVTPMVAPNGRRLRDTRYNDTEGLARHGGYAYVSVERSHDILRFPLARGDLSVRAELRPVPAEVKALDGNGGLEGIAVVPAGRFAGAILAVAERAPKKAPSDEVPGWLIGGPAPGALRLVRSKNFDATDLAFLPNGDLLVLERRFTPLTGVACRIRRIPLDAIRPGARLDGETVLEADMGHQIDNMEALGVQAAGDGRVILTLFSDDNFSILQRNLLLRFAYLVG